MWKIKEDELKKMNVLNKLTNIKINLRSIFCGNRNGYIK